MSVGQPAVLPVLTAPELALLRVLATRDEIRWTHLASRYELPSISVGQWLALAALVDATARGVFEPRARGVALLPADALYPAADFDQPLPPVLAWTSRMYDLRVKQVQPKDGGFVFDWPTGPLPPDPGVPVDAPKKVAGDWWPCGRPVWTTASALRSAGLVEVGEHQGWVLAQPSFSLTREGRAIADAVTVAVAAAEGRVRAQKKGLKDGVARLGADVLVSSELRSEGSGIVAGPLAPTDHEGDEQARLAGWLAYKFLVYPNEHTWPKPTKNGDYYY